MANNEETKKDPEITKKDELNPDKKRQIIIETDGDHVHLVKAEVSGKIELIGIFQVIIDFLNQK